MDDKLIKDLQMAEISLARVPNVPELQKEATEALTNFRTTLEVKDKVEKALDFIDQKADYELTPENTAEVDNVIKEFGGHLKIKRAGVISVSGMEAFGIEISPRQWKSDRKLTLQAMMEETMREIKRWANSLQDSFQRRWTTLTSTMEILDTRLQQAKDLMDTVGVRRPGCDQVEYPGNLIRTLISGKEVFDKDFVQNLIKGINYYSSVMKFYEFEEVRYRNTIVKYFGSPKDDNILTVNRQNPKTLDQRIKIAGEVDEKFITMGSKPFPGDYYLFSRTINPQWLKREYKGPQDNGMYVETLVQCGFDFQQFPGHEPKKGQAQSIETLSLSQMFELLNAAEEVIGHIRRINMEYNSLDFDKWTVKDNMDTLKRDPNTPEEKVTAFQAIATDYQYGINSVRSAASAYLTILASHMLTAVTLNLGCYDAE